MHPAPPNQPRPCLSALCNPCLGQRPAWLGAHKVGGSSSGKRDGLELGGAVQGGSPIAHARPSKTPWPPSPPLEPLSRSAAGVGWASPPPGASWMQRGVSGWQWWGCHAVHAELPPVQRLHPAGPRSELCEEPGSVVRALVGVLGPQAACCCAAVAPETSQSGATGGGGGWHRGTAWLGGGDGGSCCWGSPPCPSPAELLARGDERCGAAWGVAWLAAVSCARVSADCACACMPASTRRWAGTQLLVRLGATGLEAPQIVW